MSVETAEGLLAFVNCWAQAHLTCAPTCVLLKITICPGELQSDMEEAHLANATTVVTGFTDRAATAAAAGLDEAWAWGLDPDGWRAHLGPPTWPEVLRQLAIASGTPPPPPPARQLWPQGHPPPLPSCAALAHIAACTAGPVPLCVAAGDAAF